MEDTPDAEKNKTSTNDTVASYSQRHSLSLSFSLSILHLNMRACYLRVENKSKHSSCWGPHGKLRCISRETCSIRSEEMKVKKVEKNI